MTENQKIFLEKKLSKLCEKYNDAIMYDDSWRDDDTEEDFKYQEINRVKAKLYIIQINYIKSLII